MANSDALSINTVAKKLGLSVHQLRRWELLFGLQIKRGKGQQRQYRQDDFTVLERIQELVGKGWPTSQICQQLETEGLVAPKFIGLNSPPSNSEALMESVIGVRNFCERRFTEISQQLNELQQLLISMALKQHVENTSHSPWQAVDTDLASQTTKTLPPQEIPIGPPISQITVSTQSLGNNNLLEVTDQNFLTVLGKTLDLVGWSDAEADEYSVKNFGVPIWIDLGRSDTEKFIEHLKHLKDPVNTEVASKNTSNDYDRAPSPVAMS